MSPAIPPQPAVIWIDTCGPGGLADTSQIKNYLKTRKAQAATMQHFRDELARAEAYLFSQGFL